MTLSVIIDAATHGTLPDVLKTEYQPLAGQDGMFLLDTAAKEVGDQRWALEDVSGLRSSLEAARNERDAEKTKAKRYEGIDPAEHQRLMSKKAEIEAWDPSNDDATRVRLEEANATWQTKYDTDITAAASAAEEAKGKYRDFMKRAVATEAIGAVAPKAVKLLLPHVLPLLDVFPTSDPTQDACWVKGESGKPRITQVAGKTGNMSALELVRSLKDDPDFMDHIPGTGATGGGATGGGKDKGTRTGGADVDGMSPVERMKAARRAEAV